MTPERGRVEWTLASHGNVITDNAENVVWWYSDDEWCRQWLLSVETGVGAYADDETWVPEFHEAMGGVS